VLHHGEIRPIVGKTIDGDRFGLRGCGFNNFMIFVIYILIRPSGEISGALASSGEALDLVDDGADDGDVGNFYQRLRSQF
jgi:hypothetical protein